jgi:hypothetical protein
MIVSRLRLRIVKRVDVLHLLVVGLFLAFSVIEV